MDNLKIVDTLRRDEGLAKSAHQSLEDIVRNLDKLGSPVMTLAQAEKE